jgi:uncharacterized repeat protein (TIGR03843 family)
MLRSEHAVPSLSPKRIRRILRHGNVEAMEMIPWSSNYTFAVKLKLEGEPEAIAVYKPKRGETPLWDFPSGTLYRREYAAYLVSQILGWRFIPCTVVREGPYGVGTMQLFVDHDHKVDFFEYKEEFAEQLQRIALFDLIANNADRKGGHCLKGRDGTIWGIDHGLTFHPQPKLRTVIWHFGGEAIPDWLIRDLARFLADPDRSTRMRAILTELLDPAEVDIFFERIRLALEIRTYPMIGNRRSVPWPWH